VIGPYIAQAIGLRQMHRYCLTAESVSAAHALTIGLVHEVCEPDQLDARITALATQIGKGGPVALGQAKLLLRRLSANGPGDDAVLDDTVQRIATLRVGAEAREGLAAFMEKRAPNWAGD
jgi:methylglutaconyl-CoA hydratase